MSEALEPDPDDRASPRAVATGGLPCDMAAGPSVVLQRSSMDAPETLEDGTAHEHSIAETTVQSVDDNAYRERPSPSSLANTSITSYPFSQVSDVSAGPSTSSSRRGLLGRKLGLGATGPLRALRSADASAASARLAADPAAAKLAFLGYEPELLRDHDAWSLLGLTMSNLGAMQGAVFGAVRRAYRLVSLIGAAIGARTGRIGDAGDRMAVHGHRRCMLIRDARRDVGRHV